MKKLVIIVALGLMGSGAYAQKATIKAAEKLTTTNAMEARRLAKEARSHEETQNDPQAWLVSGQIENNIFDLELKKAQLGQEHDEALMFDALMAEVPFFLQTYKLESIPNEKGKIKLKYSKKALELLKSSFRYLINAGYHHIQSKRYEQSTQAFESFITVRNLLSDDKELKTPEIDTLTWDAGYLAVASSFEGKSYDKAIELAQKFKGQEFKQNEIYQLLAASYLAKADTVSAMPILEEGAGLFPKEMFFLGNIVNILATKGETDQAIAFLQRGLDTDPTNTNFLTALGGLYERKENFAKAEETFKRIYDIDNSTFDANFNLGRIYFNQGVALKNVENLDKLTEARAKEMFRQAIPYLEVAYKLDASQVYYTLASAYAQIGQENKYEEIMKANQ